MKIDIEEIYFNSNKEEKEKLDPIEYKIKI